MDYGILMLLTYVVNIGVHCRAICFQTNDCRWKNFINIKNSAKKKNNSTIHNDTK